MNYYRVQIITFLLGFFLINPVYSQNVEWETYTSSNSGLPSDFINSITIEGNGTKWFGTDLGLANFDGVNWTTYNTTNSGLTDNYILALDFDNVGELWIGSLFGDLVNLSQSIWTVYNESVTGVPLLGVLSIATSRDMDVKLFGGQGLIHLNNGDWIQYTESNSGLPNDNVYSLGIEASTLWWIGTDNGLARYDGSWTVYKTSNSELPGDHINAIAIEEIGVKWFCTNYGVARYDDQNWTIYTASNSGLPEDIVNDIAIDANNNKWFATYGNNGGLVKFDGSKWTVYNVSNSGVWNYLLSVAVEPNGNVWAGSNGFGVTVLNENGLTAVKNDLNNLVYELIQNYPNPFNPLTKIMYSIPQRSKVLIKIYDVLGNEIETLVNEDRPAGTYELTWDARDLSSGIYFYQIKAVDHSTSSEQVFVQTKKMILLK